MKKFVMGVVVGAVLAFSASTYADDIAKLVGKSVDNEYPVVLNGSPLNNKAPAIEGTSYLPVREMSEKLGLEVKFQDDTVILSQKQEVASVPTQVISKEDQIKQIDGKLLGLREMIHATKSVIEMNQSVVDTAPAWQNVENYKKSIVADTARISELEKQKAELEKQKAELSAK